MKDEWNDVLPKSSDNNIFLTWEWISTWWKYFGNTRKLRILVAEEKDEIVAIAPLMMSKHDVIFGSMKKLEFIGTPMSDYNVFILKENKPEYVKSFFDYLANCSDWDVLELKEVPETAASLKLLKEITASSPEKLRDEISTCSICPYLPLPKSLEAFMKSMSANRRQHEKRNLAKLRAKYNVEFKAYSDFGSIREAMEAFIKLHQERWKSKKMPGIFAFLKVHDFHVELAEKFAQKGWLGLHFLTADGQLISGAYSFEYNKKIYQYLTGFSPSFAEYRVGHLMLLTVIENGIKKGFNELDFLRGDEPYKAEWGAINRRNCEARFIRKNFMSRIYDWASKNRTIRSIMQKLQNQKLS